MTKNTIKITGLFFLIILSSLQLKFIVSLSEKTELFSKNAIANSSGPDALVEKTLTYVNSAQKRINYLSNLTNNASIAEDNRELDKKYRNIRSELEKLKASLNTQEFTIGSTFEGYVKSISTVRNIAFIILVLSSVLTILVFASEIGRKSK